MLKEPLKLRINSEVAAALLLIMVFGGFLLVNFTLGFNIFLYLIAALCGLILSFFYPRAGLWTIVFLTLVFAKFFTLQSFFFNEVEYKFYLPDILFIGVLGRLALAAAAGKIKNRWRLADWLLTAWLVLVALYFVLSLVYWDGVWQLAVSSLKNYAFYPLFYLAAYYFFRRWQDWRRLAYFALAGGVIIIGFLLYGIASGQGLWTEITPLSTAGARLLDFDHAFYLSMLFFFGLSVLVFRPRGLGRWFYLVLPVWLVGIVASLMRHLWLALFGALAGLYLLWTGSQRRRVRQVATRWTAALIMSGAIFLLVVNSLPLSSFSRQTRQTGSTLWGRAASLANQDDSSIAWRGAVWQSVWQDWKPRALTGLGFGQKVFIDLGDYRDYIEVRNVHNSYLAIAAQLGLVGLLLFVWLGLNVFKNLLARQPASDSAAAAKYALAGMLMVSAAAFLFQPYLEANFFSIFFWLNLGLARRFYEGFTGQ